MLQAIGVTLNAITLGLACYAWYRVNKLMFPYESAVNNNTLTDIELEELSRDLGI